MLTLSAASKTDQMKAGHTCHDGKPQQDQYLRKEPQLFYIRFIISPQDDIYGEEENILIGTMYTWGMDIKNICALNLERLHPRGHIPEIVQTQNHI